MSEIDAGPAHGRTGASNRPNTGPAYAFSLVGALTAPFHGECAMGEDWDVTP